VVSKQTGFIRPTEAIRDLVILESLPARPHQDPMHQNAVGLDPLDFVLSEVSIHEMIHLDVSEILESHKCKNQQGCSSDP
jgi:hypothetical protein